MCEQKISTRQQPQKNRMMINHKVTSIVLAVAIGIFLSLYSYQMITDPEPAMERAREEVAVIAAREILHGYIAADGELEIVDPLAPNRVVGKAYVYPAEGGWQVSGHYRRNSADHWHPYLMTIDNDLNLQALTLRDADDDLSAIATADPRLRVTP